MARHLRNTASDSVRASAAPQIPPCSAPVVGEWPRNRELPRMQHDFPTRRWECGQMTRAHARPDFASDSFFVTSAGQLVWVPEPHKEGADRIWDWDGPANQRRGGTHSRVH
jgi:hypothetical protein